MTHNVIRTVRRYRVGEDTRTETQWDLVREERPKRDNTPLPAQVLAKIKPSYGYVKNGPRLVGKARTWSVESLHTFVAKHNGL